MSAYVLTLQRGRLQEAFNDARFVRCCYHMHLKNIHESHVSAKRRAASYFYLPACVLPWNVSPKKKVSKS